MKLAAAATFVVLCLARPLAAQDPDSMVPPRLLNADVVKKTLDEAYPPGLSRSGVGGIARMKLFISAEGTTDSIRLPASTGLSGLDAGARRTARVARFSPATKDGTPIGAWVDFNVRFDGRDVPRNRPSLLVLDRTGLEPTLQSFYPRDLAEQQVGVSVSLALRVDASGAVVDQDVVGSGCFDSADRAANELVRSLRFEPPGPPDRQRWTFATVSFGVDSVGLSVFGDPEVRDTAAPRASLPPPTSTSPPRLDNRDEVSRALVSHYPTLLRNSGVGGSPVIHFRAEADGRVSHRMISKSSGICELDVAGLNVAHRMRFKPAERDGEPIATWVEIPIIFTAKR